MDKLTNISFGKSDAFKKADESLMTIFGWASVVKVAGEPVVDLQGDVIEEAELHKAVHEFMANSRDGLVMHQGIKKAEVVESIVFTKGLQDALGIDLGQEGWFIGMKFHDRDAFEKAQVR